MIVLRSRALVSLAAVAAATMIAVPVMAQPFPSSVRYGHQDSGGSAGGLRARPLFVEGVEAGGAGATDANGVKSESTAYTSDMPQETEGGEVIDPSQVQPVDPPGDSSRQGAASYPGNPPESANGQDDRSEYPDDADQPGRQTSPYQSRDPRALDRGTQYDRVEDDRDADYRSGGSFDEAIDTCSDAFARDNRAIGTVDGVRHVGRSLRVEGTLKDGRSYACNVDGEGRIRTLAVDGHAVH